MLRARVQVLRLAVPQENPLQAPVPLLAVPQPAFELVYEVTEGAEEPGI